MISDTFFDVFGEDMSPVYSDFQEFYNQWDDIKNNIFEGLTISPQWRRKAKKMVDFCNLHLARDKLLRDDYKEIIGIILNIILFHIILLLEYGQTVGVVEYVLKLLVLAKF